MSITLDILAKELMGWCESTTPKIIEKKWNNERDLMDDFTDYLSLNSKIIALKGIDVSHNLNTKHLLLLANIDSKNKGVIAEFLYDANKNEDELDLEVAKTALKFKKENLKKDYQLATRCIVSVYNNLQNRNKFHDIEFIEVFQDFGMGCALKRLR